MCSLAFRKIYTPVPVICVMIPVFFAVLPVSFHSRMVQKILVDVQCPVSAMVLTTFDPQCCGAFWSQGRHTVFLADQDCMDFTCMHTRAGEGVRVCVLC